MDNNMENNISDKKYTNKQCNNITVQNKTFKNCVFKKITGTLFVKNTIFIDCIFIDCDIEGLFSDTKILKGKINNLRVNHSSFRSFNLRECSGKSISLSTSSMTNFRIEKSNLELLEFTNLIINMSYFSNNEFKALFITSSSFINSTISDCLFVKKNIIVGSFFDNACIFKNIDFSPLTGNINSTFSKNSILGKFYNCTNRASFDYNRVCPEEGSFIGYKKCLCYKNNRTIRCIVTLRICEDAKRIGYSSSGKCRCSKAEVLKVETIDGEIINTDFNKVYSSFDPSCIYKTGEIVEPAFIFDENEEVECSSGIHFFMSKREAKNYL